MHYFLDENMVQVWEEKRKDIILLLNHSWRSKEEIQKKGFKLFYQEVTRGQLQALRQLKDCVSESEYQECVSKVGERLVKKLIKYGYLTDTPTTDQNKEVWHSQAGEYLHHYLKFRHRLDYPERPSRVLLLPTLRCFGDCIFCITHSSMEKKGQELRGVDWEQITRRVCQELHPCSVDIVGGEPLIKFEESLKMAEVLVEHNILVKLITNGIFLADEEKVQRLAELFLNAKHNIQISLDGSKETHNRIRPGVDYDQVMAGISNISKAGLTFGVSLTVNQHNLADIEEVVDHLMQYGPAYILVGPLQLSPKDVDLCQEIMINQEQEAELRQRLIGIQEKYSDLILKYDKEEYIFEKDVPAIGNGKEFHTCTTFFEEVTIGPGGELIPCLRGTAYPEFRGPKVSDYEGDLKDLWLGSELANRFRTIPLRDKCLSCDYNQQCNQGCPLETYILDGVLGGYDPHCGYSLGAEGDERDV